MDYIYVTSAEDAGNLCVRLTFNDGHQSVVDIGDFSRKHPHPQYNKSLGPVLFRSFVIDDGNVVWGDDWDLIFPIEELHRGCIDEPNETTLTAMKDAEEGHTYKDANSVKELMNYLKQ